MRRISPAISRRECVSGFTLIEMSVSIAILLLLAALIMPSVTAILRSRAQKDLEASVARLPLEAKNEAIKDQVPVNVRIDGTHMVMEQAPVGGTPSQVKAVDLDNTLSVEVVQANGKTTDTGSWVWTAYPDGTTDKGGIQFVEGAKRKSLMFGAGGGTTWVDGDLPDQSLDQWPAGNLMQR